MRLGTWLQPVAPLRQGGEHYSPVMLGDSTKDTIGRSGCLLLAIREAGVRCAGVVLDVLALNSAGRKRLAFSGPLAIIPELAHIVGMGEAGRRVAGSGPLLQAALREALEPDDGVALVWVDKDKSVPDDDPRGKHWLLALGIDRTLDPVGRDVIVCTDSAIGDFVLLDAETLDGVAKWGPGDWRRYSVREVVPLRRLPRAR